MVSTNMYKIENEHVDVRVSIVYMIDMMYRFVFTNSFSRLC
jgi:hypothetical protein